MMFWQKTKARNNSTAEPPGVVICHSPARSGKYIGSPGIAILPNGEYVASHDYFHRNRLGLSPQNELIVYSSDDRGETWSKRAELMGFWQTLFTHKGELFIMDMTRESGQVIIRRSGDGGAIWTKPTDKTNGILLDDLKYHSAPMPVVVHNQRIWRSMEDAENETKWGLRYRAFVMSVPVNADLVKAESWTATNRIAPNPSWLNGDFGGWLEGNVVVAPNGNIINILRVDSPYQPEKAAIITISADGLQASFDPETGLVNFPGGAKKFSIRYDPQSGFYGSLVNPIRTTTRSLKPIEIRNSLALSRSADLRNWEIRSILLKHPDPHYHAFQYADWHFDNEDIIAVVRTAYDDRYTGANSAHNAKYLTFHRFENFRSL